MSQYGASCWVPAARGEHEADIQFMPEYCFIKIMDPGSLRRILKVPLAKPRGESRNKTQLCVPCVLPATVTEHLYELFSNHGLCVSMRKLCRLCSRMALVMMSDDAHRRLPQGSPKSSPRPTLGPGRRSMRSQDSLILPLSENMLPKSRQLVLRGSRA